LVPRVYEHLLEVYQDVPFPFPDLAGLWLLDDREPPLALPGSALDPGDIDTMQLPGWNPGQACRPTFISATAASLLDMDTGPGGIIDYLVACINSGRTAKVPAAQVFLCSASGVGTVSTASIPMKP